MNLLRAITTVGGLTMLSRVFGFVRDILIAAILGAGPFADALFVAFKFPNMFRRLFAEGAFNLAFVPIYAGLLEEAGEETARVFAERVMAVLLWTLLVFVALVQLAMPGLMHVLAPGFVGDAARFDLAVQLTRITFPYLLFISLVSMMAGVLNSLGRFAAAAATPIILNICLIAAALVLAPLTPTPAHALAWGMAAGGVVQFVWLLVHCGRAGVVLRLPRPRLTPQVRLLLGRMAPVAVGAGIYQVNLLIDTVIASLLPAGAISYLFYADRVNQLPLGVVGVAVGTALLPLLSRQLRAGDGPAALDSQNRALEFAFLLTLPAAAALMVIAQPVIDVLFRRGAFGPEEARLTGQALAVYAVGLPSYVLVKALAPGFFAREDTATPVKAAAVAMLANLVLNLVLMGPFAHVGIAMATAASSWLNAGILATVLARRGNLRADGRLRRRLPRIVLASAGMAAVLFLLLGPVGGLLAGDTAARALGLALLVAAGLAAFAALALVLGAASLRDLRALRRPAAGAKPKSS
ncbi:MAG: murein biosynthesis integral membrane protein MurJ [Hyphomicrobiales bacterium]|nr:murein biosynthesis integral membrane protein MurJ [Hyphomicrobiales bacterium]MCP5372098.1 murein biosynthesis integral membrane protein MurJ [Hyphomicrobiales bacterium]